MRLFKRKKQAPVSAPDPTPKTRNKSSPAPMEVKLLALEALASRLSRREVAEIVGVATVTISDWQKQYDSGGLPGLYRKASSIAVRNRCSLLAEREHTRCFPGL